MTSKLVALSGAALVLLFVSSLSVPADARGGGGGGHGGGGGGHGFSGGGHAFSGGSVHMGGSHMGARGFASPRFTHRDFHHRNVHRRVFVGAPFLYDGYSYGNDCYWLRRNALS